jgi:hypothetical protein
MRVFMMVLMLVGITAEYQAYSSELTKPETRPEKGIFDLYQQGKVSLAREALLKEINGNLPKDIQTFSGRNVVDAECYVVTPANAAGLLNSAFAYEKKLIRTNPTPEALLDLADRLNEYMKMTAKSISSSKYVENTRIKGCVEYADRNRVSLLTSTIILCRNMGKAERVAQIIKNNQDYLKQHGVPVSDIVPLIAQAEEPVGLTVPVKENHWVVASGPPLPILQLLLNYYRGLELEDPKVLASCLVAGDAYMTGNDLISMLEKERTDKGKFDKILMVTLDEQTKITVELIEESVYDVHVIGILKSVKLGSNTIIQRDDDKFVVQYSKKDGFKIKMLKKGKIK